MNENCEICEWEGDVSELRFHQEADHEVWNVFECPDCGQEIDRETEAQRKERLTLIEV